MPLLASGIVGTVGVNTHWTGPDHQEMFDLWQKMVNPGAFTSCRTANLKSWII